MHLLLRHEGTVWVAEGEGLRVCGASLDELDRALVKQLRAQGCDVSREVRMRYAPDALPEWIRPYASHYFDRVIRIDG